MDKDEEREGKTVLLVEDYEAHAAYIMRIFEEDGPGWKIKHVMTLADALRWLDQNKDEMPLVISDYKLPDGEGLDLAKDAKSPEEVGYPLIILTGVGSEKLAVRTLKSGAMDYVVKGNEELKQLPRTAIRVLREWELITERRRTEEDLAKYINDLEEANCDLEEVIEKISQDLETTLSSIQELNRILMERYSDKLDDTAQGYLYKIKGAAEKANILVERLFEYVVPIYFDSSLIKLYDAKLRHIKKGKHRGPDREDSHEKHIEDTV